MILPLLIPLTIQITTIPIFVVKLGHVVINSCCITIFISVITICSNIIEFCFIEAYNDERTAVYIMHFLFTGLMLSCFLGIAGVVKSKSILIQAAFFVWLLSLITWLALVCVLFSSWFSIADICVNYRCPESFYLSDFYYKAFKVIEMEKSNKTEEGNKTESMPKGLHIYDTQRRFDRLATQTSINHGIKFEKNGFYLGASILCFTSFVLFFAMLGSMLYNYAQVLAVFGDGVGMPRIIPSAAYVFVIPFRQYYNGSGPNEQPTATGQENNQVEGTGKSAETKAPTPGSNPAAKKPPTTS